MEPFKNFYDKQQRPGCGFFPGGFKPPHAGHFAAVQAILGYDAINPETKKQILLPGSVTSDHVFVIIGHSPRGSVNQNTAWKRFKSSKNNNSDDVKRAQDGMITKEMSKQIWDLYIKQGDPAIADKVDVVISPHASPVIGMEQQILSLDGDRFKTHTINLYAGQEDQSRYQYFISDKFKHKIAEHKNIDPSVINIKANMLDRLGSATDARSQILRVAAQQADTETLKQYIPPGVNVVDVLNLLKNFRER